MKILIIGGTGTISTHTLTALESAGHTVTSFNRSGAGASVIAGDRKDPAALAAAIDRIRPDVLIDFVCFSMEDAQALAEAASGKVGHLIFVSTVDAFGFPQPVPIAETAAVRPAIGVYAAAKQQIETFLLGRSDLKVTVARPTYSMSRRFVISIFNHQSAALMQRLLRGEPVALPNGGTTLIHPSDARDTGRMIAELAGAPQAIGKTYTAGSRNVAMPQRDYVALIAKTIGAPAPNAVAIPLADIDAMQLPEAENTVFSNVTRFDLDFAFDQFAADFPAFRWQPDLAAPIRAYHERIAAEGLLDGPIPRDLEALVLERWRR
ncbi:MAG: NAD-dependent epimerase/dehydratase family protein [Devosia sp.]